MSVYSGPGQINDGLVFHYDMGNPQKSWKGKPVTNLAKTSGGVVDWFIGNLDQSVSRTTIIDNEKYRITSTSLTGLNFRMYFNLSNLVDAQTYTLSFKYQIISGTSPTFRTNDWNDTNITRNTYNLGDGTYYETATGTRATYNTTYRFMDFVISNNTVVDIWDVQLEQNAFATPYTTYSRSDTQAIVDLTGQNTVTATSLTYNSDGTFSFNGSTNYLTIPNTTLGNGNIPWTVSCWMKTTTTTNSLGQGSILSNISGGPVYSMMGVNNGKIVYWTYQNSAWTQKLGVGKTVNDGNWHMLTWVNYSNYTMDMYVDGVLDSNVANSTSGNNNPVDVIGRSWAGYFPGSIASLSRYNRALTAAEVRQNFNALRGRYGI
jgi:hypothetical protein